MKGVTFILVTLLIYSCSSTKPTGSPPIIDTIVATKKYKYVRIVIVNNDGTKITGKPVTIK